MKLLEHKAKSKRQPVKLASFPGSSAPERDIEVVHAERAWYLFSREKGQK